MQKEIASLKVIVTDEPWKGERGGSQLWSEDEKNFVLVLDQKFDQQMYRQFEVKDAPVSYITILAHELGHFIGRLVGARSHNRGFRFYYGNIPAEKDAWALAKMIFPNLSEEVEKAAMSTYEVVEGGSR